MTLLACSREERFYLLCLLRHRKIDRQGLRATFARMDIGNPNKDDLRRLARDWYAEVREKRVRDDAEFDAWLKDHRQKERRIWSWFGPANWWFASGINRGRD